MEENFFLFVGVKVIFKLIVFAVIIPEVVLDVAGINCFQLVGGCDLDSYLVFLDIFIDHLSCDLHFFVDYFGGRLPLIVLQRLNLRHLLLDCFTLLE